MYRISMIATRVAIAFMAVLVSAQESELTGQWQATLKKGDRTGAAVMDVTLSGAQVTGTLSDPSGQIWQIENGKLEGDQLTFDVMGEG